MRIRKIFTLVLSLLVVLFITNCAFGQDGITKIKLHKNSPSIIVKNKLFSLSLPKSVKGTYIVKRKKQGIIIYDKKSKKEDFGGLAFGVFTYKEPSEHAMMPGGRKIGELTDKKGVLYDVVLYNPTDVQYNYVKGAAPTYTYLYNYSFKANHYINGVNGSIYKDGGGIYGKDLYNDILKKHVNAIKEKWDSNKLEAENMSYMYNVLSKNNPMSKIGYTYYDSNADGIEELFIGEIAEGNWKGVIYDIYTMKDRKPVHVISGGSRDRYYVCDDGFICNEYSGGAKESGMNVYVLVENSTELFPQVGFKYDGYTNPNNPWFISYNFGNNEWENVSKDLYNERIKTFETYKRFDFTPLSEFK